MLVNKKKFIIVAVILTMIILGLVENFIIGGLIQLTILITGYMIISYIKSNKRIKLLNESCDPVAFLEATKAQIDIAGSSKLYIFLKLTYRLD